MSDVGNGSLQSRDVTDAVHYGTTCTASGESPIHGARFKRIGENSSLCESEFQKLSEEEQSKFVRIPKPGHYAVHEGLGEQCSVEKDISDAFGKLPKPVLDLVRVALCTFNDRDALEPALKGIKDDWLEAFAFLLACMPERDLANVKVDFISENIRLAFEARSQMPWGSSIPDGLFLEYVLPYVQANETRDSWRSMMFEMFGPLVQVCDSVENAVLTLNREVFQTLGVTFHATKRQKPDQSPSESLGIGFASCTGLSILLADVCRAVAIPARLASVPLWSDRDMSQQGKVTWAGSGNHTWVEIWDPKLGNWRYIGASEQGPLDKTWFTGKAQKCDDSFPYTCIYGLSFKPTGVLFPCVWMEDNDYVYGENITSRYTEELPVQSPSMLSPPWWETMVRPEHTQVATKVYLEEITRSLIAKAWPILDKNSDGVLDRGEIAALVHALFPGPLANRMVDDLLSGTSAFDQDSFYDLVVSHNYFVQMGEMLHQAPFAKVLDIQSQVAKYIEEKLKSALSYDRTSQPSVAVTPDQIAGPWNEVMDRAQAVNFDDVPGLREALWARYKNDVVSIPQRLCEMYEHSAIRSQTGNKAMRFTFEVIGEQPSTGYPLYICLHGGGGCPSHVNDQQWQQMQMYYRCSVHCGIYVAPRACQDTWDCHWCADSFALYDRLIQDMIAFLAADSNRVYILGYSAGGDGVYQLAPRMADRWAAANMSAGHPNGVSVHNLYHVPLLLQMGELDRAYNRNKVAVSYHNKLENRAAKYLGGYISECWIHKGADHSHCQDRDPRCCLHPVVACRGRDCERVEQVNSNAVEWVSTHVRNPAPTHLIWDITTCGKRPRPSGELIEGLCAPRKRFYWLDISGGLDNYDAACVEVRCHRESNCIEVLSSGSWLRLLLDGRLLNLESNVMITGQGFHFEMKLQPSLHTMARTLLERGDPQLMFEAEVTLTWDETVWHISTPCGEVVSSSSTGDCPLSRELSRLSS